MPRPPAIKAEDLPTSSQFLINRSSAVRLPSHCIDLYLNQFSFCCYFAFIPFCFCLLVHTCNSENRRPIIVNYISFCSSFASDLDFLVFMYSSCAYFCICTLVFLVCLLKMCVLSASFDFMVFLFISYIRYGCNVSFFHLFSGLASDG